MPLRSLAFLALAAALALTGCERDVSHDDRLTAVVPDGQTRCFYSGLLLNDVPGPKAQIWFADESAPRHYADTVKMFHVLLSEYTTGKPRAAYVHDMSDSDWYVVDSPWIDAREAFYVEGAILIGPFGPTLAPFSTRPAAEHFAAEHGGTVLGFDDVEANMVALDGGALHDTSM